MSTPAIRTTETRYGPMAYYVDDQYIGYCLERYGEYSEAEPALWRKVVKPGDCALDIGANIGTLTLPLAQMVGPAGHVEAFEPQPENFALLVQNSAPYPQIAPWNFAVGQQANLITVAPLQMLPHTNYGGIELGNGHDVGSVVAIVTIDDICQRRVDFMKIDVEGWEIQVILGAMKTIKRDRPLLYVENDRPQNMDKFSDLMLSLDYITFSHHPRLCMATNWKRAALGRHESIVSMNELCVPAERAPEIAGKIFR